MNACTTNMEQLRKHWPGAVNRRVDHGTFSNKPFAGIFVCDGIGAITLGTHDGIAIVNDDISRKRRKIFNRTQFLQYDFRKYID